MSLRLATPTWRSSPVSQLYMILGARRTPTFRFFLPPFNERGRCAEPCVNVFTSKNRPSYLSAANVARNLSDVRHYV